MEEKEKQEKEVKTEEVTTEEKGKEQPEVKEKVKETDKTESVGEEKGDNEAAVKPDAAKQPETEPPAPQPEVQMSEGNGIPLSEVVLKSDLDALFHERMSAFEAKFAAVMKENEDLKEQLATAKKDAEDTHAKYEKGDFGAPARRGEGFAESEKGGGNPNYVSYEDMWAGKKDFDK